MTNLSSITPLEAFYLACLMPPFIERTINPSKIHTTDHFKTLVDIVKKEGSSKRLWLDGLARAFYFDAKMTGYRLKNLKEAILDRGVEIVFCTPPIETRIFSVKMPKEYMHNYRNFSL